MRYLVVPSLAAGASLVAACGGGGMTMPPQPDMKMPAVLDCSKHVASSSFKELKKVVFKPSCASFTVCHEAASKMGMMDLETNPYDALVNQPVDNPAAKAEGKKRVVPGDPDASFLMTKLTLPPTANLMNNKYGKLMPNSVKLDDDTLDDIRCWIKNGAKND